jgi:hypothetical protein
VKRRYVGIGLEWSLKVFEYMAHTTTQLIFLFQDIVDPDFFNKVVTAQAQKGSRSVR